MKLLDVLSADRILVPIGGTTLREATVELVEAVHTSGVVEDLHRFEELVADTLPQDVVTIRQAFLLHFRTDSVRGLTVGLGLAPKPLHREHDPTKQARIVLLVAAPAKQSSRFLRTVSAFSQALGQDAIVDRLLAAKSADDVLAIKTLTGIELRDYLSVRDVMVHRRVYVGPDASMSEAARLMTTRNIPSLPVLSDTGEVLGMVGHRELLQHLLPTHVKRITGDAPSKTDGDLGAMDPFKITVREVMDPSVLCISEDQTVREISTMMLSRNIDRFPVVRDGKLVGFLTCGDMVRSLFGR